ncbi:hypothetical protein INR49_003292 [Caranx melampygus]|nr:hypothetical protein INR49_003292 [Caranx melampygus]
MSCPPGTALHHGKCITQCPNQYYLDNHNRCRACHSSCSSCWGPSVSQCTQCPAGLLLHQGQCVEACGEGLYPQDNTCHNCHPSCRSCVGPLASDCLRCLKPEETLLPQSGHLQHGVCTARCPAHTYLDDVQTCRECHPSCWHCTGPHADNCTSCPSSSGLHGGLCLTSCPQGFFIQDNQCQACHPSCQTCSDSSQADCTSCPPLASLLNGYCRTSCQDGYFLNAATGECLVCSSDCQRCTADLQTGIGSICLWCKQPRTWLHGDHCVPHCPQGHYGWHGVCMRCHASCEACGGAGPLSCTSCPANSVLLPSGLCAPRCPAGYYNNGHRVCQACDSQCLTCDMAGVCTSCLDPAKVLLFGECQYDSCAHQYYLNTTTRACRECDWSCNACKGPLRTDCLQCMEGYVLQDGLCTQGCSPGSYRDGDRCLGCDEHCVDCQGPGQCQRCQPPYATLQGQCVLECGRNYFLDASSQVCKPCSSDCVLCDGVGLCLACHDQTYLIEGYCAPDCGHGYYADQKTRTCHVNTQPPVLHVNGSLQVPLGGFAPLPPTLLQVKDADSPSERLPEQRAAPPAQRGKDGGELTRDDTFTLQELRSGRVRFRHQKDKARTGEFTLRAADPQLFSQPATVQVQAVSLQPPRVTALTPLPVDGRGALATITKSVLQVDDPDNPADVLVMVLEPPRHGRLTRAADSPLVLSAPVTWVKEGGMVRLDKKYLQANYKGVGTDDIVYTILASEGRPKYGEVVLVSMPADGPPEGWRPSLADDQGFTSTTSFTQQDVNDGTVSTEAAPLIQSDAQTFTIGVLPQIPGFPQLAPDCDLQITALEDRVTEITPTALSFIDSETPSEKLVFNITKPLLPGQGAIEHRTDPTQR